MADLAEAAVLAGHAEVGRRRLAQVVALVGAPANGWHIMCLRHARAVLAEDEQEAEARFAEAFTTELQRWPFWHARLQLAHGRWLRRSRRVQEARVPLRAALDAFEALGAIGWSERARTELRASGETSRRRDPSTRDDLTAQELQIAQLAATGMSNREIGQRLYLSHRTISTHLYRAVPKLGIASRGELAAALAAR
jgi:DNA-binding CsgD family transcriptional regulator